jgi:L-ribulokinase
LYCNSALHQFRQHPLDYIEGLSAVINQSLAAAGPAVRSNIRAISIDTTGSTPVAVDQTGTPLALTPGFEEDPDAMFILWKDHSSLKEVEQINKHAKLFEIDYLKYVGGFYSSEWFWSKLLHIVRKNPAVAKACYSWVEHADLMPFLLTGGQHVSAMKRNVCTAGHKALWSEEWGGLPPENFFSSLDPLLAGFTSRMYDTVWTADKSAGTLCKEWAEKLGLKEDVVIGIGAMDAHMGAVGGQIEPFYLSKVMGTSTCDMLVAPSGQTAGRLVKGICGVVNGSIIPGMTGMEAGQSAFGDVYAWFKDLLVWPLKNILQSSSLLNAEQLDAAAEKIIPELSRLAEQIPLQQDNILSVDWFNGRRTPDANALVKAGIFGLNLATDAPQIFYSLVEATCFGAKAIVERFQEEGIPIKGLIAIGGVAKKSPFIMQMLADVIGMPIKVHKSDQACALGAAMFAATAAGIYPRVEDAMKAMGPGFEKEFTPDPERTHLFSKRYGKYLLAGRFMEEISKERD